MSSRINQRIQQETLLLFLFNRYFFVLLKINSAKDAFDNNLQKISKKIPCEWYHTGTLDSCFKWLAFDLNFK